MNLWTDPWPWYVAGPLIGLFVPLMLLWGEKPLGISSSFRHICTMMLPTKKTPYLQYAWKKEFWNLLFALGIVFGGWMANHIMNHQPIALYPEDFKGWTAVTKLFLGGILVGFGTRYADGCTSGHSIMGLSNLQKSSLIATLFFFAGGLSARFLLNL